MAAPPPHFVSEEHLSFAACVIQACARRMLALSAAVQLARIFSIHVTRQRCRPVKIDVLRAHASRTLLYSPEMRSDQREGHGGVRLAELMAPTVVVNRPAVFTAPSKVVTSVRVRRNSEEV